MMTPIRSFAAVLAVSATLWQPAQARDPDDSHPAPDLGWTHEVCRQAMRAQAAAAQAMIDERRKPKVGWSLEDIRRNDQAIARDLAEMAEAVQTRLAAQEKAAGRWGAGTVFETVEWKGADYRVGGCLRTRDKLPLTVMKTIAEAPEEPAPLDRRLAAQARSLIATKKQRKACWDKPRRVMIVDCLRPTRSQQWLDRYPLK